MEILIKAAQLILSLSIIVTLHEMGHFLPARWFGIRVEKFFLFFDVKRSLWEKKIGDTVYGIGWLPLGGYVKIAGMIDESMDKEQMALPPKPDEFRSKPAWQRLIVMVGGVVVNLILGLLIYIMVLFAWGKEYLPVSEMQYGLHVSEVLQQHGLEEGDHIRSINGEPVEKLEGVAKKMLLEPVQSITVVRAGEPIQLGLPEDLADQILESGTKNLLAPRVPFYVGQLVKGGGAEKAGLQVGDKILAVNDVPATYFGDFIRALDGLADTTIALSLERDSQVQTLLVHVNEKGKVGVGNQAPSTFFNLNKEEFSFFEAIPAGINLGVTTLVDYAKSLALLFKPAGIKQMGGFGTIGGLFSATWDWQVFWSMTAFISIILGLMNILPIPALDGGHVVFLLWEMITGKAAPQRVLEAAQLAGFILVIGLVLYANGNDVIKHWFN